MPQATPQSPGETKPVSENAERPSLAFPLVLKAALVCAVAVAPAVVVSILGEVNAADAALFLAAALCGALVAFALAHYFFVAPARRLLDFLLALRRRSFSSVPVLPTLPKDELGEAGRQIGYAALAFGQMREQTDQSLEQRTLFLTTTAHQLRTPLTELIWAMGDLRRPDVPNEEKEHLLTSIDGTLQRMRLVIEHILASAGVEEGRFGYVFKSFEVIPFAKKIVDEFAPLSERQRVAIHFEPDNAATTVFADQERIALMLFDLISNAMHYTPAAGSVTVSVRVQGEKVEVAVADTGIGISEAERAMLFNKFYRSERARHMRPDGSGLGLYLAREIARKHGSELTIESQEGKGTRVSFLLPVRKEDVAK